MSVTKNKYFAPEQVSLLHNVVTCANKSLYTMTQRQRRHAASFSNCTNFETLGTTADTIPANMGPSILQNRSSLHIERVDISNLYSLNIKCIRFYRCNVFASDTYSTTLHEKLVLKR
jgi:hypothetical protein